MKHTRKQLILIGAVILIVVATSVLIWTNFRNKRIEDDGVITIGYAADNFVIERWKRDKDIFKEKAKDEGIEVIFYNANENNETQVKQIRALIGQRVDVLVVIAYDKHGITGAIDEAIKEGIKVIAYDRLIKNANVDAYISFDNVKVGELMVEELLKVAPTGNYVIINGSPDDYNSFMFNEGYMNVLQEYIDTEKIVVIEEIWAEKWREEPAYELVSDILSREIQIDAIIAANDRLAEAAIRALAERGLAGKVYVAGHDADISACQRIIEGTQHVTIYKPIRLLAEATVDLAIRLANGEDAEGYEKIDNGLYMVPYIKLDVVAVTKHNMIETVIKDGFHLKEDIFRE
ncbi:MAG: substrate-binding domain-containing protein [Alkaliphilus sp.]